MNQYKYSTTMRLNLRYCCKLVIFYCYFRIDSNILLHLCAILLHDMGHHGSPQPPVPFTSKQCLTLLFCFHLNSLSNLLFPSCFKHVVNVDFFHPLSSYDCKYNCAFSSNNILIIQ